MVVFVLRAFRIPRLKRPSVAASVCGQSTLTEQAQQPNTGTEKEHCATEAEQPRRVSDEHGIKAEEEHGIKAEEEQNNDDTVMREWTSQEEGLAWREN